MFRNKAFTLLESLIVLSIIAFLCVIAVSLPRPTEKQVTKSFLKKYESFFSQAQLSAQRSNRDTELIFNQNDIYFSDCHKRLQRLAIPKEILAPSRKMVIKANGYVTPMTLIFSNPKGNRKFSLIYSLGFGNYRVEKSK